MDGRDSAKQSERGDTKKTACVLLREWLSVV